MGVSDTLTVFGTEFELYQANTFNSLNREIMKTIPYTTVLLLALFLGSTVMEAQTTQRSSTREKTDRERPVSSYSGEGTKNKATAAREPVKHHREVTRARQPVSYSTPKNPRSDYKKAHTRVYADGRVPVRRKPNKYSDKRYYSGHHYHDVYPVLHYPAHTHIVWTRSMYRDYRRWYPEYRWRYNYGYRIRTISAFEAKYSLGKVAMVYGRVYATWHNRETDDYLLFFGGDYPSHQFTIVLPGHVARRFSWRPEKYFLGEHVTVTGLITTFNGISEVIVKHQRQVGLY